MLADTVFHQKTLPTEIVLVAKVLTKEQLLFLTVISFEICLPYVILKLKWISMVRHQAARS